MKVVMPKIGMSMQDATIVKWHVNDGDAIKEGEPLLDIQTEKLVTTVNSPQSGIFKKIVAEGEIAACGDDIAEIE